MPNAMPNSVSRRGLMLMFQPVPIKQLVIMFTQYVNTSSRLPLNAAPVSPHTNSHWKDKDDTLMLPFIKRFRIVYHHFRIVHFIIL